MSPDNVSGTGASRGGINLMVPYILYMAFISACIIYAVLIASGILASEAEAAPLSEFPIPLPLLFGALALATFPMALVIGRVFPLDKEDDPARLFAGLIRKLIIQAACFEAIAIYGLVGHILGMAPVPSLFFVGGGLLCLALLMPGIQREVDRIRMLQNRES